MHPSRRLVPALMIAAAGLALSAPSADAQVIEVSYDQPTEDRWMYPFNGTPGTRFFASTFGAILIDGFDDRDAQFVIGFDTSGPIPTGLDAGEYTLIRATVTATTSNDGEFRYDPTYDSYRTLLPDGDPDRLPDTTPGRPIELYPVGYRNGFTLETWTATSPFGGTPEVEPAQGSRNAFAAVFDAAGEAVDISNQIKDRFDVEPLAIGTTDVAQPGEFVPVDARFTFELDRCDPDTAAYFADSISRGKLNLAISSLHPASGDEGGQTGETNFPIFYTSNNPIAAGMKPTLVLEVRVGSAADYNGDGTADIFDVLDFLADFEAGDPRADLAPPCGVFDVFDVIEFLSQFGAAD